MARTKWVTTTGVLITAAAVLGGGGIAVTQDDDGTGDPSVATMSTASPEPASPPSPTATSTASAGPSATKTPTPTPTPSPSPEALFAAGDSGDSVRELQHRLKQLDWYVADVTGEYDDATIAAVSGFQAKRGLSSTGELDQQTWDRLVDMSREPTDDEKHNRLTPGPTIIGPGDSGDDVRDLQARLQQIGWFSPDVTGNYGDVTASAVEGFQAKREIPETGEVDQRTWDRLTPMTDQPTDDELHNREPEPDEDDEDKSKDDGDQADNNGWRSDEENEEEDSEDSADTDDQEDNGLDPRCNTGRALCISKATSSMNWVVDGDIRMTMDVRFGSELMPTREGAFSVNFKSRDHVSSIYDTPMPYAMFFSGGQAVHYSPDFAANGYNGASHGCVNVRDKDAVASLFDKVDAGDKVIVY